MAQNHNNDDHFVISYELLRLIQWLIENDQDVLHDLVARAYENGLSQEISELHYRGEKRSLDELQQYVVEFFALLEASLAETMEEDIAQDALERSRIPAITQVDTTVCDSGIMAASIAKTTATLALKSTHESAKEIFCRELLRRWKPPKRPNAH